MIGTLKNRSCMIVGGGLFLHIAEAMTRYFGKVYYYNPRWNAEEFLDSKTMYMGDGLPGVTACRDFWKTVPGVSLFIFPDIYNGDLQLELVRRGYNVWGSRYAEDMELDRWHFKQTTLKDAGMPVQPMKRIIGMTKLREYLQENDGKTKYIKVSATRGDIESRKHTHYAISRSWLDELCYKQGPLVDDMEFIIEDPIEAELEVGYDGFVVDGLFPTTAVYGVEMKDAGYFGSVMPYADLPEPLLYTNAKLANVLKQYKYRGFYSNEIRVGKDGKFYYLDPTCRAGSPPSQVMMELFSNWGEMMYAGAQGALIAPKPVAKYGILAFIYSERCDKEWCAYKYPDKWAQWYKFSYSYVIDGVRYTGPQFSGMSAMGSIVAVDDDPMRCIEKLKDYADALEGDCLDVRLDSVVRAVKEIAECEKEGYDFGKKEVPSVAEVAEMLT